jgi:hypothetical protein
LRAWCFTRWAHPEQTFVEVLRHSTAPIIINVIPTNGTPPAPDPTTEPKTQLTTVIITPTQKTSLAPSWARNCILIYLD